MEMRRGRPSVREAEVRDAPDGLDLFAAGEFLGEGEDVDGSAGVDELAHPREDALVGVECEVFGAKALGSFVIEDVFKEDAAEDGAFGVDVGG